MKKSTYLLLALVFTFLMCAALGAGAQLNVSPYKYRVDTSIINKSAAASVTRTAIGGRFKELADMLKLVRDSSLTDPIAWTRVTGKPATFSPAAHTHGISDVTSLTSALTTKEDRIVAGTAAQYWRGDKTWQTLPAAPEAPPTRWEASGAAIYSVNDGNVGIGTTAPTSKLQVTGLPEYADNTTARAAGLTNGAFYRTGDILKVVH